MRIDLLRDHVWPDLGLVRAGEVELPDTLAASLVAAGLAREVQALDGPQQITVLPIAPARKRGRPRKVDA